MSNYEAAGAAAQWAMPQSAAQQAQQAYQQQAMYQTAGPAAGIPPTHIPPSSSSASGLATAPQPSGVGGPNLHKNNRLATMEDKVLVTRTADEETEDGRIRNQEAIAKIRDAWVYKQIRARVDEFTEYKQVHTTLNTEEPFFFRSCDPLYTDLCSCM